MGFFEDAQSALSSAWRAVTGAAGSAASAVSSAVGNAYSAARSAAGNVSRAVGGAVSSLPSISIPSFSGAYSPPSITQAAAAMYQEAAASAARIVNDPVKIATQTAQAAGKSAGDVAKAANDAYRLANGIPLEVVKAVVPTVQTVTKAAASGISGAGQTVQNVIAAVPKVELPTIAMPSAAKVAAEIAAAPANISGTVTKAAGTAATSAGNIAKAAVTAIPSVKLPTVETFTAPASSLLKTSVNIPGITGTGSVIPNAPATRIFYDQIIGARNQTYDAGGEIFAKGWEKGNTLEIGKGAGIYAIPAAVDFIAPLDAINLGNKIATGRAKDISSDELIAGGIDIALLGLGAATGGAGYVAGRGILKGSRYALAGEKAAATLAKSKEAAKAAEIGAMAAIGATGGKMIKFGNLAKSVKTLIKPEVKAVAKTVKKVEKPAAKAVSRAKPVIIQKAPHAAAPKNVVKKAAVSTATNKTLKKAAVPAVNKAIKPTAKIAAAPSSSLLKTAAKEEKVIAKEAPSTIKTVAKEEKALEKAAIETTAKPGSAMAKYGAIAIGAGLTGIGLASYLNGGGNTPTPTPDPTPTPQPVNPVTDPYITTGGDDGDLPVYADGELTPDDYAAQQEALDQALADGTITQEQHDQASEALKEQQDAAGGNFPAVIGADTPYQGLEDAAQDATRSIPGDPLKWFRENGLAAPVMGGLVIALLLAIWWAWKHYTKKTHNTGSHHGKGKSPNSTPGTSTGNKIVMV